MIEAGLVENGTMVYGVSQTGNSEPEEYTEVIPSATDVGKYYVWYKVKGTDGYSDIQAQKIQVPATIALKGYKKTSKKVTKLKGRKKYYIRIRTVKTVKGTKYYSPWSKVRAFKTK